MAQSTVLSSGLFSKLTSFPAVLPDTTSIAALASGGPPQQFFSYGNMRSTGIVARLRDLQSYTPAAAGVTVSLTADTFKSDRIDMLAASGLDPREDAYADVWNAAAANTLAADVANNTINAIPLWWAAWAVEIEKPSIAQKLQFPHRFTLTAAEQAMAQQMGITPPTPRGVLPRSLRWIIDNEFRNQIIDAVPYANTLNVSSSSTSFFIATPKSADEILVLASLSLTPGSGSDGLTYQLGVDQVSDFLELPAYGIGTAKPLPIFVQATQQIQLQATSTAGNNAVQAAGVVWHVRKTDEIRVRLGEITSGAVYDKIQAGVL